MYFVNKMSPQAENPVVNLILDLTNPPSSPIFYLHKNVSDLMSTLPW